MKETSKLEIRNIVRVGLRELKKFDEADPKSLIYLQQAGNKMYKAYTHLLERISGRNIRTPKGVSAVTYEMKDKSFIPLFKQVRYLHSFYYEGDGEMTVREVKESAKEINRLLGKY